MTMGMFPLIPEHKENQMYKESPSEQAKIESTIYITALAVNCDTEG